jgi:hypothetical protein
MPADETRRLKADSNREAQTRKSPPKSLKVALPLKRKAREKARGDAGRQPGRKPYPVITFEQALGIGRGIAEFGAGHPTKRTTLLDALGLLQNQSTRDLITASGKYGITTGGHDALVLGLTEEGAKAVSPEPSLERTKAWVKLAITDIEPFNTLYEKFRGRKMPAVRVMHDLLEDVKEGDRAPCVDIFVQNAKFTGLLQIREGAEFITSLEEVATRVVAAPAGVFTPMVTSLNKPMAGEDFESVCFFISPIGADETEQRQHSDAILASYIEKTLESVEPRLRVIRADKITQPGMITKQVLEYLLNSRLVVADLSYHNPNVFYELAVRHATGKPIIHIKRTCDPLPFDNKDFRTIDIKFEDKFDILAEIETIRSTIAQFSRQALDSGDNSDNPLLIYFPDHRFSKVMK